MQMSRKKYISKVRCPVCGKWVNELFEASDSDSDGSYICSDCMCMCIINAGLDVVSSKDKQEPEYSDAVCPGCGSRQLLIYTECDNPIDLRTYRIESVCGFCGASYTVNNDVTMVILL